jgi:hypothetical protein
MTRAVPGVNTRDLKEAKALLDELGFAHAGMIIRTGLKIPDNWAPNQPVASTRVASLQGTVKERVGPFKALPMRFTAPAGSGAYPIVSHAP